MPGVLYAFTQSKLLRQIFMQVKSSPTSTLHDAAGMTSIQSNFEIEMQYQRRNEVIVLDSGNDKCLVTSHLSTPTGDGGDAMGMMFSVETAESSVEVQTIEFYADETKQGSSVEVTVYTKTGFFFGFEEEPNVWTKIASATLPIASRGGATMIPQEEFQPVTLEPGSRQSFYITLNTTGLQFSDITDPSQAVGSTYTSDNFLSLSTGVSLSDLFFFNARHQKYPRMFNGALFYNRRLRCEDAKESTTVELDYILETPSKGVVLTPISDVVRTNVEAFINTTTTLSQYASNNLLTLDGVQSQAALIEGTCPNGWRSCYQLTSQVALSYLDFPTSGKIVYDVLALQPKITSGLSQHGFSVEYNGATPLSYNYSFILNGVPDNSNLDEVESKYFERVTLEFLEEALQNLTSATVLAIDVDQAGSGAASTHGRYLSQRRLGQTPAATGVIQFFATIYGMDQLPEALAPLDQALAEVFNTRSDDFANDLASQTDQPGTISDGGEGSLFANLFSVRAVSTAGQNKTGLPGPSSSSTSTSESGKILGIPAIWFAVLCIGIIMLMLMWLAYMYTQDKREMRRWRRMVTMEERKKRKNKKASPCREDSYDYGSDAGLLATDEKEYSTDGMTAEGSVDTASDSSPIRWQASARDKGGLQRFNAPAAAASCDEMWMQKDLSKPTVAPEDKEQPSVPNLKVLSSPAMVKESHRDPQVQSTSASKSQTITENPGNAQQHLSQVALPSGAMTETQEQSSKLPSPPKSPSKKESNPQDERSHATTSCPSPDSKRQEVASTEALAKSPNRSKSPKKERKSPRKDKVVREIPTTASGTLATLPDPSTVESTAVGRLQETTNAKNLPVQQVPAPPAAPHIAADQTVVEQHTGKEDVNVIADSTPPPSASRKKKSKSKSPLKQRVAAAKSIEGGTTIDAVRPKPNLNASNDDGDKEEPSELAKVQARITKSPLAIVAPPAASRAVAPSKSLPDVVLEEILPMASKETLAKKKMDEPSELEKIRARVMRTAPPTALPPPESSTSKTVSAIEEVPKGSILKAKDVFDKKSNDHVPNKKTKPDPPITCPPADNLKEASTKKDALTVELLSVMQSNSDWTVMRDRLANMNIPLGREKALLDVLLVCCAQEETYSNRFAVLAEHVAKTKSTLQLRWKRTLEQGFTDVLQNISRFTMLNKNDRNGRNSNNTPVRNVAKFFAHLLHAECIPWSVLRVLHEEQNNTGSSTTAESRLFVKTLVQQVAKVQTTTKETTESSRTTTTTNDDETASTAADGLDDDDNRNSNNNNNGTVRRRCESDDTLQSSNKNSNNNNHDLPMTDDEERSLHMDNARAA